MKLRRTPLLIAAIAASVVALSAALVSPSLSAAARVPDDAGPLPRFDAQPFADEKTPPPTAAEWKPTVPVALTGATHAGCNAYRLREWVKIRCSKLSTSALALLGGAREGVTFYLDQDQWKSPVPPGGEAMFPVRRGDRRVIEWSTFGDSYEGPGAPEVAFLISESWAPNDPGPTIIAP